MEDEWEWMVTFYGFPESLWKHLRTTNIVEGPFPTRSGLLKSHENDVSVCAGLMQVRAGHDLS
ncbi:MAG: hypothetical protein MUO50_00510 [Longimicrobiales bacterium]|nr:hypothetical protein [Longimicrobiales bacterium]